MSGLMLRTTNGGAHWKDVTPVDSSGQRVDVPYFYAFNSHLAWLEKTSMTAPITEVFRTVDGGRVWKSVSIRAMSVTSISFINPRQGWLIAFEGAYTGKEAISIYSTTDGGETWIAVSSVMPDEKVGLPFVGGKTSITFVNPTTGWITVAGDPRPNQPYLYVTRDGGHTWRPQSLPLPPEVTPPWEASPMPPRFFTPREGIFSAFFALRNDLGKQTGGLAVFYATHDGGTTWRHIAPAPAGYQAVVDMNHAWSLNEGVLRVTSDGGREWITLPPNPLLVDVSHLDFISPQVGWAVRNARRGFDPPTFPFLLKTLDGGRTWSSVIYEVVRQ
jgi:photosystem II stability/assembly factor-like uncharacterized protein